MSHPYKAGDAIRSKNHANTTKLLINKLRIHYKSHDCYNIFQNQCTETSYPKNLQKGTYI